LIMGFSLLRALEFFVIRKMEMPETINHLLCGWSQKVIQKSPFRYNRVVQALLQERKGDFMAKKNV